VPSFKSRYAVVTKDESIIRRGPSQDEDQVTQVDSGTKVTVLNYEHGWYQLKFPKGTVGWMRGDLLKASAPMVAAKPATAKAKLAKVTKKSGKLVAAKSTPKFVSRMPVAMSTPSATVDGKGVPAINGLVEKPDDVTEKTTVAATLPVAKKTEKTVVAMNEAPKGTPTTAALLHKAYNLKGTRYVWGGLSSRGLDCSGFTTTVFKSVGIHLPRTSRSQSTIGVAVPRESLRAGDLLFFKTHRSTKINHVAMYIGENRFIHASSGAGRVRVDNLAGYYGNRLVTARRVEKVAATDDTPEALPVDPRPGHGRKAAKVARAVKAEAVAAVPKSQDVPVHAEARLGENKGDSGHSEMDP
jgi:cell wall-associated NlpC family hydrolase